MGRRPLGIDLVERMVGPPEAKERLMAVLESLNGEGPIEELAQICGVGRTRFYELRERALCGALVALLENRPGPKARVRDVREQEIADLEAEVGELRMQLEAARVRTEIALTMPHLLQERDPRGPKATVASRGALRARKGGTTGA